MLSRPASVWLYNFKDMVTWKNLATAAVAAASLLVLSPASRGQSKAVFSLPSEASSTSTSREAPPVSPLDAALVQAGRDADLAQVKILLNRGARVNAIIDGQTALTGAASYGNFTLCAYLLSRGADPNLTGRNSPTPLTDAVESGNADLVQALIRHGARVSLAGGLGETPLMRAAADNRVSIADLLTAAGANADQTNANGDTALFYAADAGSVDVARKLLAAGSKINVVDASGYTPLMTAANNGRVDFVRLLARRGASIDRPDNFGETALSRAAAAGNEALVKLLTGLGASVNAADGRGITPLMRAAALAAGGTRLAILTELLKASPNVDLQNEQGVTALMYACACRRIDAAIALLDARASVALLDSRGADALTYLAAFTPANIDIQAASKLQSSPNSDMERALAERLARSVRAISQTRAVVALCAAAGTARIAVIDGILDAGVPVDEPADSSLATFLPPRAAPASAADSGWPEGTNALTVAVAEGNGAVARELVARGAVRSAKEPAGDH